MADTVAPWHALSLCISECGDSISDGERQLLDFVWMRTRQRAGELRVETPGEQPWVEIIKNSFDIAVQMVTAELDQSTT